MISDGRPVRYTWGLCWAKDNYTVAMFNVSREEADRIAERSNGELVVRPVSTRKYIPNRRQHTKGVVHAC